MLSNNRIIGAFTIMVKAGAALYTLILVLIITANLSLFHPNWPFGLFASFMKTLIVASPIVFVTLLLFWRRAVLPIVLLVVCAFYPFFTFSKFVKPSDHDCTSVECISVVAANLRNNIDALAGLAQTEATSADIIIILEVPYGVTSEDLLTRFSMAGEAQVALLTEPHVQLGSRLAVLSRKSLDGIKLDLEEFNTPQLLPRGIVRFNYVTVSEEVINFVVVHPPPPKSRAAMAARDAYLDAAGKSLLNKSNFVMIGDFNMTPWESGFAEFPGKRAGDPRWIRTWNALKFWQRIVIDHALIGDDVELVETKVLPDIGSDHFPIRVVIR